jgi:hypothetical protein
MVISSGATGTGSKIYFDVAGSNLGIIEPGQMAMNVPTFYYMNPSAAVTINTNSSTLSPAAGGNSPLSGCSGLLVINEQAVNGDACLWLIGGGQAQLVSQSHGTYCVASTTAPPAGTVSVASDGTEYAIYNNIPGARFGVFNVCTRNGL